MYNKTKSLEFKNFRKFADFPALEFNDITYLVGANNSGKSTFVKAVMLVFNYLQQRDLRTVDFNANGVDTLNIISFDRAIHKSGKVDTAEEIVIGLNIHDYHFTIKLGAHKHLSKASVLSLNCTYWGSLELDINPVARTVRLREHRTEVVHSSLDESAKLEIQRRQNELILIKDKLSPEYIDGYNTLRKLKALNALDLSDNPGYTVEFDYQSDDILEVTTALTGLISKLPLIRSSYESSTSDLNSENERDIEESFVDYTIRTGGGESYHYDSDRDNWIVRLRMDDFNISCLQTLFNEKNIVNQFLTGIKNVVSDTEIVYLPATLKKQSALFFIRDTENPLVQAIHSYYQNAHIKNKEVKNFIKYWLQEFKVGDNFRINEIEGEAYTMEIRQNGIWISLADKGMGAIQATLLILRLASLIKNQQGKKESIEATKNNDEKNYIVVIEEPELNLHPALQSKLCDLFFEVHREFSIEFIIETHSEYMIRKSQLLTAEYDFTSPVSDMDLHPFSVLYLPEGENDRPYAMEYREDGKFRNDFGSGFFDETRNIVKKML